MNNPMLSVVTATLLSLSFSPAFAQDNYTAEILNQCTDQAQGLEPQDASVYIDSCIADANANLGLNQEPYVDEYPDEAEIEAEDNESVESQSNDDAAVPAE